MIYNYEFTVILRSSEEESKNGLSTVERTFQENGVEVTKKDVIGLRTLSYPIDKQDRGYYVYFEIKAEGSLITKMSRVFQLDGNILKFLFINPER